MIAVRIDGFSGKAPSLLQWNVTATGVVVTLLPPLSTALQCAGHLNRYFLAQDNDTHWYLVPEDMRGDWDVWLDLDQDSEAAWTVPKGARRLDGGPSAVTFEKPTGGGS